MQRTNTSRSSIKLSKIWKKVAAESKTQSSRQARAKSEPHEIDTTHLDRIKQDEQWKNFSHTKEMMQAPSIAQQQHGHATVEELHKTTVAQMLRDMTKKSKLSHGLLANMVIMGWLIHLVPIASVVLTATSVLFLETAEAAVMPLPAAWFEGDLAFAQGWCYGWMCLTLSEDVSCSLA
ncbi:related to POP4-protein involved in processing of tRNAs and rRNAs [Sporisorium scitamineum]|uniref:Related to POP4-protein involved in processing of tRNAs and rRNAs n=1 Tax=Sporisorium scitamineum TaxID=49012 RepID=A0A127Z4W0_9BASI|nr:related to POP4-protein involved in processing of tRNAs and rRNAs [Sporisorium scitamineum]